MPGWPIERTEPEPEQEKLNMSDHRIANRYIYAVSDIFLFDKLLVFCDFLLRREQSHCRGQGFDFPQLTSLSI